MQRSFSQIVHVLPVEEVKLNNHHIINCDNAHVGTLHWWLVHRQNIFSLTPSFLETLMIIHCLHVVCVYNEGNYARFNKRLIINFCTYVLHTIHRYLKSTYTHMPCGHWPAGSCCVCHMLTCMCTTPRRLGP